MAATDTSIAVTIKAAIDASFASAMAEAAKQIDKLAEAAAGASKKSKSGSSDKSGDETVKLEQRAQELRIQGEARANQALFSLGQELATQMVAQAQSLEDQRYQIEIEGVANRMAADSKNKGAEAKDSAEAEVILQEHLNRQAEINQRYAEDQKKLSTETTRDYVQSQQQQVAAGMASYAEQYKAGTISAAQREAADNDLLNTTQRNIDERLQAEISSYAGDTTEYSKAQNEKARIDQEFLQKHRALIAEAAQDEIAQWRGVVGSITSAEGELVNDIFTKRQSLQRDLAQIGERMVEQEVSNDIKAFTEKEIYNALGLQSDRSTAQEGLLFKLGTYLLDKTGFFSAETAKTSAAEAGTAVRTTLQDAGMAKGLSNVIKSATQVITADAGQAAGGAQASASQIPYIGWLIAPAAAAEAFSAVMGFASFDVGTNYVPHDMPAMIHAGERIVPKADNTAIMNAINGGGARGDTHHHWQFSPTFSGTAPKDMVKEFEGRIPEFASLVQKAVRGGYLRT